MMKSNQIDKIDFTDIDKLYEWCDRLEVPKTERLFVNLIDEHVQTVKQRKQWKKDGYKRQLEYSRHPSMRWGTQDKTSSILAIDVSEKTAKRAYVFMNYFIKAVQALGGSAEVENTDKDNTLLRWRWITGNCTLYEKQIKYRQSKEKVIGCMRPGYESIYTGELIFELSFNTQKKSYIYSDTPEKLLEEQINELFKEMCSKLHSLYEEYKKREEIKECETQERHEKWIREQVENEERKFREDQKRMEREQRSAILKQAENWKQLYKLEKYILSLKEEVMELSQERQQTFQQYFDLVEKLFDRETLYQQIEEFISSLE